MTRIYKLEKLWYLLSYLGFVKFLHILTQVTLNLTQILVSVTTSKFIVSIYVCGKSTNCAIIEDNSHDSFRFLSSQCFIFKGCLLVRKKKGLQFVVSGKFLEK